MKERGGKTGVLVGLDLPSAGGGTEAGVHIGATVWVRGETFKAESETADLWQPKWKENQTVLATAIHTPDRKAGSLEGAVAGSWSLGIVEQSQGEGCCWLKRDRLGGCEGGDHGGKCWWRKARQSWKQGNIAELHIRGGAITIACLVPHASIDSWTKEKLAHQTPDALNYRQGPHQGAPLSAWCANLQSRTPARGPPLCAWCAELQRREPSKYLNGQSYGERLTKEAFWSPATRGSKKDCDRDITPAAEVVHVPAH